LRDTLRSPFGGPLELVDIDIRGATIFMRFVSSSSTASASCPCSPAVD